MLAADFTTTSASYVNAGLAFAIPAGKTASVECDVWVKDPTTTAGALLLFAADNAPQVWNLSSIIRKTTVAALTGETSSAIATTVPASQCTSSCVASFKAWKLTLAMKAHATLPSTINLQTKATTGTATVGAGSVCVVRGVAP